MACIAFGLSGVKLILKPETRQSFKVNGIILKKNIRGDTMTTNREENYIEDNNEQRNGHEDTRYKNFVCENPDEHLGCDPGIDVAG